MPNRFIPIVLSVLLIHLNASSTFARPRFEQDEQRVARIKSDIAKCGVGERARITIKTLDGKTLKGYVEEAGADTFQLRNSATRATTVIAYRDVAQVNRPLSKWAKFGTVWGILMILGIIGTHGGGG